MGLRGAIRASLYLLHRRDLGCPTEESCDLFKTGGGFAACEGCPKWLNVPGIPPDGPQIDSLCSARLAHLVRLESMVNVGCKFAPDDLSPQEWDELIVLSQERNWMSEHIRKRKDGEKQQQREVQKTVEAVRKDAGVPPPGGSLFPRKKPMQ